MPVEKLYLELTTQCNMQCSICYRNAWNEKLYDMEDTMLQRCIEQINSSSSIKEVVLGGIGEPTYHPAAAQVMRALKKKKLTLTTNGMSMDLATARAIADCVHTVVFSVDGTADTFYSIRGFPLEGIIENIKLLNSLKNSSGLPALAFQMVVSKTNRDEAFAVADLAAQLKVKQLNISHLLPYKAEDCELALYKPCNNKELYTFFGQLQNHAHKYGLDIRMPDYELKTIRRCRFIENNSAYITVSGDIAPCYRFAHNGVEAVFGREKTIFAHSFGNLKSSSIDQIWESAAYTNFRKTVYTNWYPSCTDCDLVDGCDMVRDTQVDCYGCMPSCADCLWSRNFIYCV